MSHVHGTSAYDDPGTPEEITRRTFMANATITLTGIIGLGLAIPVIGALMPKTTAGSGQWEPLDENGWKQLQSATETPVKIDFTLTGRDAYLPPQNTPESVWGIKVDPDKFKAARPDLFGPHAAAVPYPAINMGFVLLSPICPHLGCRFNWNSDANRFLCPCHGSQFSQQGTHLAGPADRGLDPLPLREYNGKAEVTWIRYAPTVPNRIVVSYIN